jgi:hypothetical protein
MIAARASLLLASKSIAHRPDLSLIGQVVWHRHLSLEAAVRTLASMMTSVKGRDGPVIHGHAGIHPRVIHHVECRVARTSRASSGRAESGPGSVDFSRRRRPESSGIHAKVEGGRSVSHETRQATRAGAVGKHSAPRVGTASVSARVVEAIEAEAVVLLLWRLLLWLEILHDVLRIFGDLPSNRASKLKWAEAAIGWQVVGLQRPPLRAHFL